MTANEMDADNIKRRAYEIAWRGFSALSELTPTRR
jgi:hypothetical protein